MKQASDQLAWITGGGTGLGRALALEMARHGWRVAVSGRREGPLEETAAQADNGRIRAYPCDVGDAGAVADTARRIESEWSAIDLAVFNAGTYNPAAPGEFDPAAFRHTMEINFLGTVNGIAAVLPGMRERGSGHIAMTASLAGYRGLPNAAPYGTTKAAMIHLAESLRLELADSGIRVTVVNPGFVETPMTGKNRFPMPFIMAVEPAAQRMYRGLMSGAFEVVFPRRLAWTMKVLRVLPYALYFPLIRRITGV